LEAGAGPQNHTSGPADVRPQNQCSGWLTAAPLLRLPAASRTLPGQVRCTGQALASLRAPPAVNAYVTVCRGCRATMRLLAFAFVAVFALVFSAFGRQANPAEAHALLERSDPGAGTVVTSDQPLTHVSLWFSEPVEVAFNGVEVTDSSHRAD